MLWRLQGTLFDIEKWPFSTCPKVSKSNLKSTTPLCNQFYINFMIFFLNFWDLQPISMLGFCLACLRSYPILAIFGPKRPSAASWAGLGCLKNNFPYYFNTTLAFGRCRQDCEKKIGPIVVIVNNNNSFGQIVCSNRKSTYYVRESNHKICQ